MANLVLTLDNAKFQSFPIPNFPLLLTKYGMLYLWATRLVCSVGVEVVIIILLGIVCFFKFKMQDSKNGDSLYVGMTNV